MKWYKHSDGKFRLWPENVKSGYEFLITPDFKQVYRKVK